MSSSFIEWIKETDTEIIVKFCDILSMIVIFLQEGLGAYIDIKRDQNENWA